MCRRLLGQQNLDYRLKHGLHIMNTISDAVQAALIYVRNEDEESEQWDLVCHKMEDEILYRDRSRGAPQLAAAARILADEVERLRKEMTRYGVSDCCKWRATTAGKAGATCWWECSFCHKPCRIVIPDNNTQLQ